MTGPVQIREARPADIEAIRALADSTWRKCYPGIISEAQIDYMLGWMYAAEKIRSEMISESIDYLIAELAPPDQPAETVVPVGFAAFGPGEEDGEIFLHKLYIDPVRQRLGIGSALLRESITRAKAAGASTLGLRVNRANIPAIRAYEKHGFVTVRKLCSDIGGGFVMDDFVMTRPLAD